MTVPKSKRSISRMEYISNAESLAAVEGQANCPKSRTYEDLADRIEYERKLISGVKKYDKRAYNKKCGQESRNLLIRWLRSCYPYDSYRLVYSNGFLTYYGATALVAAWCPDSIKLE